MTKRPLVYLTLFFIAGIFIAEFLRFSFPFLYLFASILLFFIILAARNRIVFTLLLVFLAILLGAIVLENHRCLPRSHIAKLVSRSTDNLYTVRGIIAAQPNVKDNFASFVFKTDELQSEHAHYSCCGTILVYARGSHDFSCGDRLILRGTLGAPFSFGEKKRQTYREYLYNQDIYHVMRVSLPRGLLEVEKGRGCFFKRYALRLKTGIERIIFSNTGILAAGILDAMILGEKKYIPVMVNKAMIHTGTVHILVVSGFNVGIVAFIIYLILKLLRCPRRPRIYLTIPLLMVYCLVTGASNPVVRATVMAVVYMMAYVFKKEPDIYTSLMLAALCILAVSPRQIFDIGFQLSFVSVLAIVTLYPLLKKVCRLSLVKNKILLFIGEGFLVSLSAWIGTSGLILYYFRIFCPITVLANIVIVPLATLITLCGFSLIIMVRLIPATAPYFGAACELLVKVLLSINAFLAAIPGAYFTL